MTLAMLRPTVLRLAHFTAADGNPLYLDLSWLLLAFELNVIMRFDLDRLGSLGTNVCKYLSSRTLHDKTMAEHIHHSALSLNMLI
jgi:hypothetical protein